MSSGRGGAGKGRGGGAAFLGRACPRGTLSATGLCVKRLGHFGKSARPSKKADTEPWIFLVTSERRRGAAEVSAPSPEIAASAAWSNEVGGRGGGRGGMAFRRPERASAARHTSSRRRLELLSRANTEKIEPLARAG